jgi:hypothetical protein
MANIVNTMSKCWLQPMAKAVTAENAAGIS